ncbi:hypothetical protein M5X00_10700 [Paenibacillus alvei]|uniref:Uncharacterized protein n=2 Tax=Paenibacillus alvei TaxID=44250 RepID=A0ABT4H076_PAEAL|nr:hypothetical protein [Paenibacillus alvei]MCY9543937.1 hypothetical protein [Paenibacillus alvei]MCY9737738.1 hypothetical protein [Paenibacillus alvei]MCY9754720.1 hypothetical protein [Paenibacillus alvei]MCY9762375.1 hypothetical protein [Paenibacillus alvei]MCY9768661.1 hypothetical protein [Paenibacillus alvei]
MGKHYSISGDSMDTCSLRRGRRQGSTPLATTQAPAGSVQDLFCSSLFVGDSIIGGTMTCCLKRTKWV